MFLSILDNYVERSHDDQETGGWVKYFDFFVTPQLMLY